MKLDFVNNAENEGVDSTAPQPRNHELAQVGATDDLGIVAVNSRALVDEALRQANVFSSEDLVEEGNTLPLIPLNIDPPAHRRLPEAPRSAVCASPHRRARGRHRRASTPLRRRVHRSRFVRFHQRVRGAVPVVGIPWDDGASLGGAAHADGDARRDSPTRHCRDDCRPAFADPTRHGSGCVLVLRRNPRRSGP